MCLWRVIWTASAISPLPSASGGVPLEPESSFERLRCLVVGAPVADARLLPSSVGISLAFVKEKDPQVQMWAEYLPSKLQWSLRDTGSDEVRVTSGGPPAVRRTLAIEDKKQPPCEDNTGNSADGEVRRGPVSGSFFDSALFSLHQRSTTASTDVPPDAHGPQPQTEQEVSRAAADASLGLLALEEEKVPESARKWNKKEPTEKESEQESGEKRGDAAAETEESKRRSTDPSSFPSAAALAEFGRHSVLTLEELLGLGLPWEEISAALQSSADFLKDRRIGNLATVTGAFHEQPEVRRTLHRHAPTAHSLRTTSREKPEPQVTPRIPVDMVSQEEIQKRPLSAPQLSASPADPLEGPPPSQETQAMPGPQYHFPVSKRPIRAKRSARLGRRPVRKMLRPTNALAFFGLDLWGDGGRDQAELGGGDGASPGGQQGPDEVDLLLRPRFHRGTLIPRLFLPTKFAQPPPDRSVYRLPVSFFPQINRRRLRTDDRRPGDQLRFAAGDPEYIERRTRFFTTQAETEARGRRQSVHLQKLKDVQAAFASEQARMIAEREYRETLTDGEGDPFSAFPQSPLASKRMSIRNSLQRASVSSTKRKSVRVSLSSPGTVARASFFRRMSNTAAATPSASSPRKDINQFSVAGHQQRWSPWRLRFKKIPVVRVHQTGWSPTEHIDKRLGVQTRRSRLKRQNFCDEVYFGWILYKMEAEEAAERELQETMSGLENSNSAQQGPTGGRYQKISVVKRPQKIPRKPGRWPLPAPLQNSYGLALFPLLCPRMAPFNPSILRDIRDCARANRRSSLFEIAIRNRFRRAEKALRESTATRSAGEESGSDNTFTKPVPAESKEQSSGAHEENTKDHQPSSPSAAQKKDISVSAPPQSQPVNEPTIRSAGLSTPPPATIASPLSPSSELSPRTARDTDLHPSPQEGEAADGTAKREGHISVRFAPTQSDSHAPDPSANSQRTDNEGGVQSPEGKTAAQDQEPLSTEGDPQEALTVPPSAHRKGDMATMKRSLSVPDLALPQLLSLDLHQPAEDEAKSEDGGKETSKEDALEKKAVTAQEWWLTQRRTRSCFLDGGLPDRLLHTSGGVEGKRRRDAEIYLARFPHLTTPIASAARPSPPVAIPVPDDEKEEGDVEESPGGDVGETVGDDAAELEGQDVDEGEEEEEEEEEEGELEGDGIVVSESEERESGKNGTDSASSQVNTEERIARDASIELLVGVLLGLTSDPGIPRRLSWEQRVPAGLGPVPMRTFNDSAGLMKISSYESGGRRGWKRVAAAMRAVRNDPKLLRVGFISDKELHAYNQVHHSGSNGSMAAYLRGRQKIPLLQQGVIGERWRRRRSYLKTVLSPKRKRRLSALSVGSAMGAQGTHRPGSAGGDDAFPRSRQAAEALSSRVRAVTAASKLRRFSTAASLANASAPPTADGGARDARLLSAPVRRGSVHLTERAREAMKILRGIQGEVGLTPHVMKLNVMMAPWDVQMRYDMAERRKLQAFYSAETNELVRLGRMVEDRQRRWESRLTKRLTEARRAARLRQRRLNAERMRRASVLQQLAAKLLDEGLELMEEERQREKRQKAKSRPPSPDKGAFGEVGDGELPPTIDLAQDWVVVSEQSDEEESSFRLIEVPDDSSNSLSACPSPSGGTSPLLHGKRRQQEFPQSVTDSPSEMKDSPLSAAFAAAQKERAARDEARERRGSVSFKERLSPVRPFRSRMRKQSLAGTERRVSLPMNQAPLPVNPQTPKEGLSQSKDLQKSTRLEPPDFGQSIAIQTTPTGTRQNTGDPAKQHQPPLRAIGPQNQMMSSPPSLLRLRRSPPRFTDFSTKPPLKSPAAPFPPADAAPGPPPSSPGFPKEQQGGEGIRAWAGSTNTNSFQKRETGWLPPITKSHSSRPQLKSRLSASASCGALPSQGRVSVGGAELSVGPQSGSGATLVQGQVLSRANRRKHAKRRGQQDSNEELVAALSAVLAHRSGDRGTSLRPQENAHRPKGDAVLLTTTDSTVSNAPWAPLPTGALPFEVPFQPSVCIPEGPVEVNVDTSQRQGPLRKDTQSRESSEKLEGLNPFLLQGQRCKFKRKPK
eukprot:Cvel_16226.t1-p1 / transcript=Cvel_16226.t1 / gene=Cvel_16226 / organism=Chromera_velia_CCMP2878 / gene_product=hypothetical protein / transcript_product=hypothetical protein / location=Cvel_scaffold1240:22861-30118(-) / protein_length=2070 / sequence_SO=supercontig / SO=protein_coding / is_pseudo=false